MKQGTDSEAQKFAARCCQKRPQKRNMVDMSLKTWWKVYHVQWSINLRQTIVSLTHVQQLLPSPHLEAVSSYNTAIRATLMVFLHRLSFCWTAISLHSIIGVSLVDRKFPPYICLIHTGDLFDTYWRFFRYIVEMFLICTEDFLQDDVITSSEASVPSRSMKTFAIKAIEMFYLRWYPVILHSYFWLYLSIALREAWNISWQLHPSICKNTLCYHQWERWHAWRSSCFQQNWWDKSQWNYFLMVLTYNGYWRIFAIRHKIHLMIQNVLHYSPREEKWFGC